ncbi:ATP-binding protein [Pseudoalteromonas xiamenensis]|uniref:PAS domain-containing hybrid sensor histidine kinase/response regulator n=1 Tax=Pseudoalteromonas xiamenensis TaxID=882626 RepID=UPI0035EE7AAB
MHFTPLKHYKRAIIVAVLLPVVVAAILCLHLYQLKLERAYQSRVDAMLVVDNLIEAQLDRAKNVFDSIESTVSKPLSYAFKDSHFEAVSQFENYYYQSLNNDLGEVVGTGAFNAAPMSRQYWFSLYTLGPVFTSALSLSPNLEAIAYVNEQGMAFVKRRDKSSSELLTRLINHELRPDFSQGLIAGSHVVNINKHAYFALGKLRLSDESGYLLLIYDLTQLSHWMEQRSVVEGELRLYNQYNEQLASSWPSSDQPLVWPSTEANSGSWFGGIFLTRTKARPINVAYFEPESMFKSVIRYEQLLEFGFLSLFLLLTALGLFWLSLRLFIKPVEQFVSYLVSQDVAATDPNYSIPRAWLPWFRRIKRVVAQKQSLLTRISESNVELDQMLRMQTRALERSLEAKDRQTSLLNTMLDSVPDLIYFKNIDSSFLGCNRAFESFIGFSRNDLVGRTHDEVTDKYLELLDLEKDFLVHNEVKELKLTFAEKVFEVRLSPFYHEQKILGSMTVLRDITEIDNMLNALKQSESKFRAAIEFAANAVLLIAIDGTIIELNKAAKRFFSNQNPELGKPLSQLFMEKDYPRIADMFSELLQEHKKVLHVTVEQSAPYSHLQLSGSLVWDAAHQPQYFVLNVQNITALTNARLAAERATLAKSRFIANISHEIRTPLNAILGLSELIRARTQDAQTSDSASKIDHAAKQLLGMLNSILDFAKVESQKGRLIEEPFLLMDLVDTCKTLTEVQCQRKGLQFDYVVDREINPTLKGDPSKLKQVLLNLLSNAVKFTESGNVALKLKLVGQSQEHQRIEFSVEDTGIGIKAEEQEKLFDAFTQGDDSSARQYDGIGLGLAIVKHEVMLMGGEIELESSYKKGSRFFFSLNLEAPLKAPQQEIPLLSALEQQGPNYIAPWLMDMSSIETFLSQHHTLERLWLLLEHSPSTAELAWIQNLQEHGLAHVYATSAIAEEIRALGLDVQVIELPEQGFWQTACERICKGETRENELSVNSSIVGALLVVVDDNPLNLKIAQNMLSILGASVVTCQEPLDAFELITRLKPDAVLMDIHMPHIDGFTLTKQIREVIPKNQMPILALTADIEIQQTNQAEQAGMNGVVTKPIDKVGLLRAIDKLLLTHEPFYDEAFALSQMMGNRNLLGVMLKKFAKLVEEQKQSLCETQDINQLGQIAHSIKGTAAGLGFKRLAATARIVEQQGKSETLEHENITNLVNALVQVREFISKHREESDEQERPDISR